MSDEPPPGRQPPPGPPPPAPPPGWRPAQGASGQGPPAPAPPAPGPGGGGRRSRRGPLLIVAVVLAVLALGGVGLFVVLAGDDVDDEDAADVASEISTTIDALTGSLRPEPTPTVRPFDTPTPQAGVAPGATETSVFELAVGTCFDDPGSNQEIQAVAVIPCEAAHDNEVFAVVTHPADQDTAYPGREALITFGEDECRGERFTDYVGVEYQFSRLYVSQLTPTDASWQDGDREIVCLVYDTTAPLEGTVEGTGD